ncbi:MAG: hypothetical protein WBV28_01985 [Terracidiphilus sp.]
MPDAIYCRNGHFIGFFPNPNHDFDHVRVIYAWQEAQANAELARMAFCSECGAKNVEREFNAASWV